MHNSSEDKYNKPLKIIQTQIPFIKKIIEDEQWYEGERRNCYVPQNDPIVQTNVCSVVMRVGSEMREKAIQIINQEIASQPLSSL